MTAPPSGFGQAVYASLSHYVSVADVKVGVLTSVNLGCVGYLLAVSPQLLIAKYIAMLAFGISFFIGGFVLYPRIPRPGSSPIFWEDILESKTAENYFREISTLSVESLEEEYARQNFLLSKVLKSKYQLISVSSIFFLVGISFAIACFL